MDGGRDPALGFGHNNRLLQGSSRTVIDQDLVVVRHNGKPVCPLGECCRRHPVWEGDPVGQGQGVCIQPHDKGGNKH